MIKKIFVNYIKTKTTFKRRDENEIKINGILVVTKISDTKSDTMLASIWKILRHANLHYFCVSVVVNIVRNGPTQCFILASLLFDWLVRLQIETLENWKKTKIWTTDFGRLKLKIWPKLTFLTKIK